jgi:hypothetical protein
VQGRTTVVVNGVKGGSDYLKASNTREDANFGASVAISGDTLAIGAPGDSSNATGINGKQSDMSMPFAGAVYVFARTGTTWTQQAYLKASNTQANAAFGKSLSLFGNTLAVGAYTESSNATGVNGNQGDTSVPLAGAVYVFTRTGTAWAQQAYLKASNSRAGALFGRSLSMYEDQLAVGAFAESSNATGVNGNQADSSMDRAGAVYVFARIGTSWTQQAYIKASNTHSMAEFGLSVALSKDVLAVGAPYESSNASGVDGNQADTSMVSAGAAYVFSRIGGTWTQRAYVKASDVASYALFGSSVALSGDVLAVGVPGAPDTPKGAGTVYVFGATDKSWAQRARIKPSRDGLVGFGDGVSIAGGQLAIASKGWIGDTLVLAGVHLFRSNGSAWTQFAYIDGQSTGVAFSGNMLVAGATEDSSNATGVNGNRNDTTMPQSGAVFVYR